MTREEMYGPGGVRAFWVAATQNRHAWGGPDSRLWGARACAERTKNMAYMVVTLDVSKLSGWLNAYAYCRVETRGVRCGARRAGRGRDGVDRQQPTSGMHGERARL